MFGQMFSLLKAPFNDFSPKIFRSSRLEFNLIVMPLWISILYLTLITNFPDYRLAIFTVFLCFLGETHFAATWLFFTNSENRIYFKKNIFKLFLIPCGLIIAYISIGMINVNHAIFIGSVVSSVHVVRQSIGVFKIYGGGKYKNFQLAIYLFSVIWLIVGFARFYLPSFPALIGIFSNAESVISAISIISVVACAFTLLYARISIKENATFYSLMSGVVLYAPYLFVNDVKDAVVAGVGMHWCQYIALTGKIYILSSPRLFSWSNLLKFIFIGSYAFLFTYIDTNGGTSFQSLSYIVLIPLSLQLYHYYLDAFIWRFSDSFIRDNIGVPLFNTFQNKYEKA